MKRPVREQGRQVSFVVDEEDNKNYLDMAKELEKRLEKGSRNHKRLNAKHFRVVLVEI